MDRRRKSHSSAPHHEQPGDPPSKPPITAVESLHPVIIQPIDPPPPSKPPITAVESLHPVIICKVKTSRALLFRFKRHHEALGFIQDSISCYPNWGHLRLVEACIHKHMVDHVAKDCVEKIKASEQRSCLSKLAEFNDEWDKVNEECLRGLKIENSNDPGIDRFYGKFVMGLRSKESRIADERKRIIKILLSSKQPPLDDSEKPFEEKESSRVEEDVKEMEKREKKVEETFTVRKESETSMKKFKGEFRKIHKCESVWSALSDEKKRGFREVNIEKLECHLELLEYHLAVECLREAIDFAKEHKTWKSWECCGCLEKFGNLELYRTHFRKLHWFNLDEQHNNLKSAMESTEVASELIEMITNCVWKPLNTDCAIDWLKLKSKTSPQKFLLCDDDTERAGILESICDIYQLLLKNKCLARTHVDWPIRYAISEFESIIPVSQFRHHNMETLKVICLLGASQLKNVLKFLKSLVHISGLCGNSEMSSYKEYQEFNIKERIVFSRDFSTLLLDERLFRGELNVTNYFDAIADDGSAVNFAVDECKDDCLLPYSNDILSWLYVGLKINEDLYQWKAVRGFERGAPEMVFRIFVEECSHLAKVCERISEISSKVGAVEAVYTKCLEEIKKRKKNPDLFDLLCKRKIVLQGDHDDIASRIESEIISDLLKDASAAELLVSMSSSGLRMQERVRKIDDYIRKALKTLKLQLLEDVCV
ncbi:hypothetical protein EZV62_016845 [Acer yangbiense]|uniref:C2H2-type domain-containing protein n=1 Tax=Acer yangbiense TaxID=1000413 RepID=A0A5C7HRU5_9ROSI|nr:hypothetical protein EZV62_016845 [Acer yangbiense]